MDNLEDAVDDAAVDARTPPPTQGTHPNRTRTVLWCVSGVHARSCVSCPSVFWLLHPSPPHGEERRRRPPQERSAATYQAAGQGGDLAALQRVWPGTKVQWRRDGTVRRGDKRWRLCFGRLRLYFSGAGPIDVGGARNRISPCENGQLSWLRMRGMEVSARRLGEDSPGRQTKRPIRAISMDIRTTTVTVYIVIYRGTTLFQIALSLFANGSRLPRAEAKKAADEKLEAASGGFALPQEAKCSMYLYIYSFKCTVIYIP